MRKLYFPILMLCFLPIVTFASKVDSMQVWRDSVNASYSFKTGLIVLKGGLAHISVPKGYKYLDAKQSNQVISELWGNPADNSSLGMLFPEKFGPADAAAWAIDVTYSEEGHIKDDDAKDINYDDLLKDMQADTEAENETREQNGYAPVTLIGWAVPPYYDEATHKLHWAQELQFGTEKMEVNTLNYNIRILGRKGYLMLNAIGDMSMLPAIKKDIPGILASVEFKEGNQYADFNPDMDKVATYGIGGLVAGKVLAKVGFFAIIAKFFKVILLGLLKFWKLAALALVSLFSGIKRFFGRKKATATEDATDQALLTTEELPSPELISSTTNPVEQTSAPEIEQADPVKIG